MKNIPITMLPLHTDGAVMSAVRANVSRQTLEEIHQELANNVASGFWSKSCSTSMAIVSFLYTYMAYSMLHIPKRYTKLGIARYKPCCEVQGALKYGLAIINLTTEFFNLQKRSVTMDHGQPDHNY